MENDLRIFHENLHILRVILIDSIVISFIENIATYMKYISQLIYLNLFCLFKCVSHLHYAVRNACFEANTLSGVTIIAGLTNGIYFGHRFQENVKFINSKFYLYPSYIFCEFPYFLLNQ